MQPSIQRLIKFVYAASGMPPSTQQMLSALGVSAATMSNWKTRGMSKEGALRAEAVYGCSAHWLLTGEGQEQAQKAADSTAPAADSWPFRRIDFAKVKALSPARLAELETAVLIAAGHLGLDVRRPDDSR